MQHINELPDVAQLLPPITHIGELDQREGKLTNTGHPSHGVDSPGVRVKSPDLLNLSLLARLAWILHPLNCNQYLR